MSSANFTIAFSLCSGHRSDVVTMKEAGPMEEPWIKPAVTLIYVEILPENFCTLTVEEIADSPEPAAMLFVAGWNS